MNMMPIDVETWKTAIDMRDSYSALLFLAMSWESLHGTAYAVIPKMGELYAFTLHAAFDSAKPPMNFPKMSYDDLHAKLYSTFPGKDVLRDAANNVLWAPMIITGSTATGKSDWALVALGVQACQLCSQRSLKYKT